MTSSGPEELLAEQQDQLRVHLEAFETPEKLRGVCGWDFDAEDSSRLRQIGSGALRRVTTLLVRPFTDFYYLSVIYTGEEALYNSGFYLAKNAAKAAILGCMRDITADKLEDFRPQLLRQIREGAQPAVTVNDYNEANFVLGLGLLPGTRFEDLE